MGKKRLVLFVLSLILFIYYLIPLIVISPIENDSIRIATGACFISQNSINVASEVYRYSIQPGTYIIISQLTSLLGSASFTIFYVTSTCCHLGSIFLLLLFIKNITNRTLIGIFPVLLLFQELFVNFYYPSSNSIAFFPAMIALYFSSSRFSKHNQIKNAFIILLISFAAWLRFDAILFLPVIIYLQINKMGKKSSLQKLKLVISFVISTAVFSIILYKSSKIEFPQIFNEYLSHHNIIREDCHYKYMLTPIEYLSYISFFTLPIVLFIIVGIKNCLKEKKWESILITFLGFGSIWLPYLSVLTTPKYLLYGIPFIAFIIIKASEYKSQLATFLFIMFFIIQYGMFSLKVSYNKQDVNLCFGEFFLKPFHYPSQYIIYTADNNRLISGILYFPYVWYADKLHFKEIYRNKYKEIKKHSRTSTFTFIKKNYYESLITVLALQENNYTQISKNVFIKENCTIKIKYLD